MTWDSYRLLSDPTVRGLLPKVVCVHDPEIEAEFPTNMSGKITIRAQGRTFARKVVVPFGEPSNFPGLDGLRAKFQGLADPVLGAAAAGRLADAALVIGETADVQALMRSGAGPG